MMQAYTYTFLLLLLLYLTVAWQGEPESCLDSHFSDATALLQTQQVFSGRASRQALEHPVVSDARSNATTAANFTKHTSVAAQSSVEVVQASAPQTISKSSAAAKIHELREVGWSALELGLVSMNPTTHLTSSELWAVAMLVALLILFDVCVVANRAPSRLYNFLVFVFFLLASKMHSTCVGMGMGWSHDTSWFAAYVLELVLSLNNLFAYYLIFKAFAVPVKQAPFVLTLGIYGAMMFRVACTVCLSSLFTVGYGVQAVAGLILIISGGFLLYEDDTAVEELCTVKFVKGCLGSHLRATYDENRANLTAWSPSGHLQVTMPFLVICVIAVTDILFSMDSLGAKMGEVSDLYINISSTLMAMASLRSLFFIIGDMADSFCYVKYGMCLILGIVGMDMISSKWYHVSLPVLLISILVIFGISILASMAKAAWCYLAGDTRCAQSQPSPDLTSKKAATPESAEADAPISAEVLGTCAKLGGCGNALMNQSLLQSAGRAVR